MKIDNQKILAAIVATALLLFPVVAFTTGPLRIGLGFLFIIFFPGYTLLSALFPKRGVLGGIERLALSFGLSIAVVPLIGLILSYTPWEIKLYPVLISITIFIIAMSAIGWYRQRKLPAVNRLSITLRVTLSDWSVMSKLHRGLSISLMVVTAAALGFIGYTIAVSEQSESFTEFYILGIAGKTEDYPEQLVLGEACNIVIGVVNYEHQPASYRVRITIDGVEASEVNIGTLPHEAKYEERVNFIPQVAGEKQRVDLYLYKNGEEETHFGGHLHLYIDVLPQ